MLQLPAMIAFFSGLSAGAVHVVSGPDHVAAVAPLALRTPRAGVPLGAMWGIGHGSGVLIWLAVAALFRACFGFELDSLVVEGLVGVALIALGALSLRRELQPEHVHLHGDARSSVRQDALPAAHAPRGHATALAMGALHGTAGASHLLGLLPALGLSAAAGYAYAGGYLAAGVLAMAGVGRLLGGLAARAGEPAKLRKLCALALLAVGAFWLISSVTALARA